MYYKGGRQYRALRKGFTEHGKPFWRKQTFIDLQNKWYEKLKSKGFNDLEHLDKKSGAGQDTPFLAGNVSNLVQSYDPLVENYFRSCRNYLHYAKFPSKAHKVMWECFCEGYSYRQMIPIIKKKAKISRSVFWISDHLNKLKRAMVEFNLNDPERFIDEDE